MKLSNYAILFFLAASSPSFLFSQTQKYIGVNLGSDQSLRNYSTFSLGLRKDRQINTRNALGFDLQWYMPKMSNGSIELEAQENMMPDTVVQTLARKEAFRFQISHRYYFVPAAEKTSIYFSYGFGLDVFHLWERLAYYDTRRYDRPLIILTAYSYEELDFGLSGHAALGCTMPLKGSHSLYTEVAFAYSVGSLEFGFFTLDRQTIPDYISFKTGYRFGYVRRKKT